MNQITPPDPRRTIRQAVHLLSDPDSGDLERLVLPRLRLVHYRLTTEENLQDWWDNVYDWGRNDRHISDVAGSLVAEAGAAADALRRVIVDFERRTGGGVPRGRG